VVVGASFLPPPMLRLALGGLLVSPTFAAELEEHSLVRGTIIQKEEVLEPVRNKPTNVLIFRNVTVSCKGQVFVGSKPAEHFYDGCDYSGGTCVWDSHASHVSKKPYCALPFCVPHAPGPSEGGRTDDMLIAGPLRTVVVLTQPQWGAYYHFVIDSLSRLVWMNEQYPHVVSDSQTAFHTGYISEAGQAWARLMGINTQTGIENRLIDGWWKAEVVYFPPSNGCMNQQHGTDPHAVTEMQQQVRSEIGMLYTTFLDISALHTILLLRRDARISQSRSVQNHDDVVTELKNMLPTWTLEVLSDYPQTPDVVTACSMFGRAHLILGPHGAGMSHLVCARGGVPLVEFQQEIHSWDYEKLAMKLDMPYVGIKTNMGHYGPGRVNIPALRSAVVMAARLARPSLSGDIVLPEPTQASIPTPASVGMNVGAAAQATTNTQAAAAGKTAAHNVSMAVSSGAFVGQISTQRLALGIGGGIALAGGSCGLLVLLLRCSCCQPDELPTKRDATDTPQTIGAVQATTWDVEKPDDFLDDDDEELGEDEEQADLLHPDKSPWGM